MVEDPEHDFLGAHRDKMWTYFILLALLIAIVVVLNLVWKNPSAASAHVRSFVGLPAWALATVMFLAGALLFWVGLKVEPDWPEAIGAFLIAGSAVWFEMIVGWARFNVGGLFVVPYLIPVAIFLVLLMYGIRNSR
ncbi:MAG: hypothetical protein ABI467_02060 [Kofleriaceae bacterium]